VADSHHAHRAGPVPTGPARSRPGPAANSARRPSGAVLTISPAEWTAFLAGVRNGEFDLAGNAPADDGPM
jgi:hypothetical protein